MTWQPIETAPKDGTVIDLWLDGERAALCRWWGGGWEQAYAEATDCFAMLYDAEPTHWMPLPDPPLGPDNYASTTVRFTLPPPLF